MEFCAQLKKKKPKSVQRRKEISQKEITRKGGGKKERKRGSTADGVGQKASSLLRKKFKDFKKGGKGKKGTRPEQK